MAVGGVCSSVHIIILCSQLEREGSACANLHQQLEKMSVDLEASLADLEANKISNLLLRQQVN